MANRPPRQTRGRQRIPIQRIENQDDMYATFSKRRLGLYKKASELSTLCGVDVGIIIFSPTDNPFSFFHPSMESVVERYRNPNQPLSDYARLVEAHTRARIEQLNQRLDEIHDEKDQLKEREKHLDEVDKTRVKGWWEQPVENMNKEQLKEWKVFFQDFRSKVRNRIEELRNGASSSSSAAANLQPGDAVAPPPGVGASLFAPAPFQHQYYNVPPPFPGDGSGPVMMSEQFYVPQPAAQDQTLVGGGGGGGSLGHQYSVQYNLGQMAPPQAGQDLSGASGSGSGQYPIPYGYGYFPPLSGVGPSSSGGGASFDQLSIPYNYMAPPQGQDPSSSSGGGNQAGPSHHGNFDR